MKRRLMISFVVGWVWLLVFPRSGVAVPQRQWEERELRAVFEQRGFWPRLKTEFGPTPDGDYTASFKARDPINFDGQTLQDPGLFCRSDSILVDPPLPIRR